MSVCGSWVVLYERVMHWELSWFKGTDWQYFIGKLHEFNNAILNFY